MKPSLNKQQHSTHNKVALRSSRHFIVRECVGRYARKCDIEMLLTDWNNAKARMLPFEGLASQIHILDVPKLKLNHVLRTIACETSDAKVSVLAGEILDKSIELSIFCKELDQCSRVADKPKTDKGTPRNDPGHDVRFEYSAETKKIRSYACEGHCMQVLIATGKSEFALLDCSAVSYTHLTLPTIYSV